jgi:hypothetical protein
MDAGVVEVPPGCVIQTEDCYDGVDNDCDGLSDCADPDCMPVVACVPRPSGNVGTTIPTGQQCPKGFAFTNQGMPFGASLDGGGACTGCQCGTSAVTACKATLTTFVSTTDCQADANGKSVATISWGDPTACLVPDNSVANVFGAALTPWSVASSACAASGTPVRPTASFTTQTSFCPATNLAAMGNNGCPAGSACMRKPPASAMCVLLADASACPAGTKSGGVLYAGLQDNRSCGPCACDLQGASCDGLVLQMGSDYACTAHTADIKGGAHTCTTSQPTGVYVPGYHLTGSPTNGTCKPASALSGAVTPTGGRSLCCLP